MVIILVMFNAVGSDTFVDECCRCSIEKLFILNCFIIRIKWLVIILVMFNAVGSDTFVELVHNYSRMHSSTAADLDTL